MIVSLLSLSLMIDEPVAIEKKPAIEPIKLILDGLVYLSEEAWIVWIQNKEHTKKGPLDQNWSLEAVSEGEVLIKDSSGNVLKLTS
jgi:hypothetical protein